jgi:hypothetical protein
VVALPLPTLASGVEKVAHHYPLPKDDPAKITSALLTLHCLDPSHEAHGRPLELTWR